MAKVFRFRLDRVLDLRRLHEKMKKKELAQTRAAVTRQQNDMLQLLIRLDQGKGVSRDLRKEKIDMTSLRMQEQHLNGLMRSKLAELAEASKKVRVLERLREKRKAEYMLELGREEQKFLDEVAQNMTRLAAEKKESLR